MNTHSFSVALAACVCLTLWSAPVHGQDAACKEDPSSLTQYRAQALELRGTFFLLPDLREIYQAGKVVPYARYSVLLAESERAAAHFRAYKTLTTTAAVTAIVGLGAIVAGVIVWAPWRSGGNTTTGVLFAGSGGVLLFWSSLMKDMAYSRLNDAVNAYNHDLTGRLLK